jgi:hypothetical protein
MFPGNETDASAVHDAIERFAHARSVTDPHERRVARRRACESLHDALANGPVVPVVRTIPVLELPLPTPLAFGAALHTRWPFVVLRHRALLVQYLRGREPHTLIWNATDARRALEIPALHQAKRAGAALARSLAVTVHPPVDVQIGAMGIVPDAVDVLAYDTLDAQSPAAMLARFPRARIAVTESEWRRYARPSERDRLFLVPGPEIDRARVDEVDEARVLGDGVVLVRTGGRCEGHLALVVHTAQGVLVAAGNTLSLDGYAPASSRLPGLAESARRRARPFVSGFPVLGDGSDAMALENVLADRLPGAPTFPFVLPTLEVVPHAITPRLRPAALMPDLALGTAIRGR